MVQADSSMDLETDDELQAKARQAFARSKDGRFTTVFKPLSGSNGAPRIAEHATSGAPAVGKKTVKKPRINYPQDEENITQTAIKSITVRKSTQKAVKSAPEAVAKDTPAAAASVKKPKAAEKRAKEAAVPTRFHQQKLTPGEPKWSIVRLKKARTKLEVKETSDCDALITLKPRIWASSKEELVAVMPELSGSKFVNGLSWVVSEAPLLLLEGENGWTDVEGERDTIELIMTRDFICARSDTQTKQVSKENPAYADSTLYTIPKEEDHIPSESHFLAGAWNIPTQDELKTILTKTRGKAPSRKKTKPNKPPYDSSLRTKSAQVASQSLHGQHQMAQPPSWGESSYDPYPHDSQHQASSSMSASDQPSFLDAFAASASLQFEDDYLLSTWDLPSMESHLHNPQPQAGPSSYQAVTTSSSRVPTGPVSDYMRPGYGSSGNYNESMLYTMPPLDKFPTPYSPNFAPPAPSNSPWNFQSQVTVTSQDYVGPRASLPRYQTQQTQPNYEPSVNNDGTVMSAKAWGKRKAVDSPPSGFSALQPEMIAPSLYNTGPVVPDITMHPPEATNVLPNMLPILSFQQKPPPSNYAPGVGRIATWPIEPIDVHHTPTLQANKTAASPSNNGPGAANAAMRPPEAVDTPPKALSTTKPKKIAKNGRKAAARPSGATVIRAPGAAATQDKKKVAPTPKTNGAGGTDTAAPPINRRPPSQYVGLKFKKKTAPSGAIGDVSGKTDVAMQPPEAAKGPTDTRMALEVKKENQYADLKFEKTASVANSDASYNADVAMRPPEVDNGSRDAPVTLKVKKEIISSNLRGLGVQGQPHAEFVLPPIDGTVMQGRDQKSSQHVAVVQLSDGSGKLQNQGQDTLKVPIDQPGMSTDINMDVDVDTTQYVPLEIPPEIQVLVDSYVHGMPIIIIASRVSLLERWNIPLAEEYAYVFLGLFKVHRVWQERVVPPYSVDEVQADRIAGRVEWRFRFRWAPGGEEFINFTDPDIAELPWWRTKAAPPAHPCTADSDDESTASLRAARKSSPNYRMRHVHLGKICCIMPLHLLAKLGDETPDEVFPRGWFCGDCGKLNQQAMMRRRRCTSVACKDKPSVQGYAKPLWLMRDPQQMLPSSSPYNQCPADAEKVFDQWVDGMFAVSYQVNKELGIVIKHIHTRNLPALQQEPSELLAGFQLSVPLAKSIGDMGPYFSYTAGVRKGKSGEGTVPWGEVPACVEQARDFIRFRAEYYGERSEVAINYLKAIAWVATGSRGTNEALAAKQHDVTLLCLGYEVTLAIAPRSRLAEKAGVPDLAAVWPAEEDVEMLDGTGGDAADYAFPAESADAPVTASKRAPKKTAAMKRLEKNLFEITLVHGDILMLSGDDFEYSLKRGGTTILIVAS